MGSQLDLARRPPGTREPSSGIGAGGDERRMTQDAGTQPTHRKREVSIDVLGALDSERHAQPAQRPAPLGRGERKRLGLDERHLRARSSGQ